jgi:hypothetical protein
LLADWQTGFASDSATSSAAQRHQPGGHPAALLFQVRVIRMNHTGRNREGIQSTRFNTSEKVIEFSILRLQNFSALDDVNQYDNNGQHQQNMNKSAHGITADQSEHPKNEQYNGDGPQHIILHR